LTFECSYRSKRAILVSDYEDGFITRLSQFGLNEKEARVYFYLLNNGGKTVTELTEYFKGYRVNTYRILESLTDKGLLETSMTKPRIFAALPLHLALHLILQRQRNKVRTMESAENEFLEYADPMRFAPDTFGVAGKFRLVNGGNDILTTVTQMITNAQRTTLAIIRPRSVPMLSYSGVRDACRGAAERGVEIRIVTDVLPNNLPAIQAIEEFASIRCYSAYSGILFYTADESESITIVTTNHQRPLDRTDKAFWITNCNYATYLSSTFEMVWQHASALDVRLAQILATGAPAHSA
jgi:sugar-specific transcriptional regulator TrmB